MSGGYTRYPSSGGSGSGNVTGAVSSVDSQVVLFNGTTGKSIKAASGSGIAHLTSGVLTVSSIVDADISSSAAISNSKFATMATLTLKGNNTGGSATPTDLTVAQVNAILPVFTGVLNGLVPLSGGGTANFLRADGTWVAPSGSGTVTTVSVASTNGFAGTVATATSTPVITMSTSITGVLKGNGTAISQATAGTDYSAGTSALATGILKSTTATGALTIAVAGDFPTLNQSTTGTAANITGTTNSTLTTISSLVSVGTITTGTWTGTTIAVANGGTAKTTVTTAPAASSWAGWDANKNLSSNSSIEGYATTATAAGTTTLVVGSAKQQYFTGVTTQTVKLPVTSTLVLGQQFQIVNNSTGAVTVQSSGANTITVQLGGTISTYTCILTSGTTAASWNSNYASSSFKTPTIQSFLSGSATYTTPTSPAPLYLKVTIAGGGGGGGGSSSDNTATTGGSGGTTTFGTSLLTATGGSGGTVFGSGSAAAGGSATVSGPAVSKLSLTGGSGGNTSTIGNINAGNGGTNSLGGAGPGGGGGSSTPGAAGITNTGGGGGGGGGGSSISPGGGGGAGAFIEAFISTPNATYAYAVGSAGTAGAAGTSGFAGGAGGSGIIVVEEHYQ